VGDSEGDRAADAPPAMATWDGVAGRGARLGAPTEPQPARASARAGNTMIKGRRIQTSVSGPRLSHP
jgi:hypothetical protein